MQSEVVPIHRGIGGGRVGGLQVVNGRRGVRGAVGDFAGGLDVGLGRDVVPCTQRSLTLLRKNAVSPAAHPQQKPPVEGDSDIFLLPHVDREPEHGRRVPFNAAGELIRRLRGGFVGEKEAAGRGSLRAVVKEAKKTRDVNEVAYQQLFYRRGQKPGDGAGADPPLGFVIFGNDNDAMLVNKHVTCGFLVVPRDPGQLFAPRR